MIFAVTLKTIPLIEHILLQPVKCFVNHLYCKSCIVTKRFLLCVGRYLCVHLYYMTTVKPGV